MQKRTQTCAECQPTHKHTPERSSSRWKLNDKPIRTSLNIHWLTSLSLLSLFLLIFFVFFFLLFLALLVLFLLLWAHAGSSAHAWRRLGGLEGFWVAEGAAVVVKEPAERELIKSVLRVLPVRRAECVQGPGAVPAVAPCSWASFLFHWVKVGRVHRVSNFGPIGCWLLPQIAGEIHLGEEGVSLDLSSAVGTQAVLCRTAETADDVDRLWAQFDLWRYM